MRLGLGVGVGLAVTTGAGVLTTAGDAVTEAEAFGDAEALADGLGDGLMSASSLIKLGKQPAKIKRLPSNARFMQAP